MRSDREAFLQKADVSRETLERLDVYADLLRKWTPRINLVSPSTIPVLWTRHFLDSFQLSQYLTATGTWIDLGSGGGFPGAVLAILAADDPMELFLVESDKRKATFLRTVSRETGVSFEVIAERAELMLPMNADRLSARAFAPLPQLLDHASRHLKSKGKAYFLKGTQFESEIVAAQEYWRFDYNAIPSQTDPEAVILEIGDIQRV